jgi:hypothetical protein
VGSPLNTECAIALAYYKIVTSNVQVTRRKYVILGAALASVWAHVSVIWKEKEQQWNGDNYVIKCLIFNTLKSGY